MPNARVFGPVRGAGVQINEVRGGDNIIQGVLGSTVIAGVFERGAEGDVTVTTSKRSLLRKMGNLLEAVDYATPSLASIDAPLCSRHFWDRSKGAGVLACLRVVPRTNDAAQDDRPTKSSIRVFNRETIPVLLGTIEANNGGNWGGKRKTYLGEISGTPGTDFPSANQIQLDSLTAKELQIDEFRNALVTLDGLPGNSYRVVNNTTLGLLTLEADADVESDWGAGETSGSESSDPETFNLESVAQPWNLTVTTDVAGPDTATILATAASVGDDGAPSTPVAAGDVVFTVTQDGTTTDYTVAFNGEASLAAILATLNAGLPGCSAQDAGTGEVIVYTDQRGTGATIVINDTDSDAGTVADVFSTATPTETAGTGDVVNSFKVTATEIQTDLDAAILAGVSTAVTAVASGVLTVSSPNSGSTSTVQMGGTIATILGFDGLVHTGTDGPADLHVQIVRENLNERDLLRAISVDFKDSTLRPGTEFGMLVKVDGEVVLNYENLSMETNSSRYWVNVVNNDPNNDIIVVTDSFTGDRSAATARPANHYGVPDALTSTRLTIKDPDISNLTVAGDWVPTITWGAWGSVCKPQRLTVTMTNATDFIISTDIGNRTWSGSLATPVVMEDYVGTVTINAGTGTPQAADWFYIYLKPLESDEAIGGKVVPNVSKAQSFKIIDNGVSYVDVSELNDLTDGGTNTGSDEYRIEYSQQFEGGYDGYIAGMVASDYTALLQEATSPLRKLKSRRFGQVKMAVPGISYYSAALTIQQALQTLASEYNWMAKNEFPWSYHDFDVYYEEDLKAWANDTLGRSEYTSIHFPSYAYIVNPLADNGDETGNMLVPTIGFVLGDEAAVAVEYSGHHKAPAGTKVLVPEIIELPVIGKPENPTPLDEEVLNPAGINIIKWVRGGSVAMLWGDRTLAESGEFRFMHKRNMLSQYENDLLEGFDFAIFEINDPDADEAVLLDLYAYFLPEFRNRAIRGDSFIGGSNPAAIFKMDAENNTDATRAAGDQIVEISLRLADTTERLRIYIGSMGVSEG